MDRRLNRRRLIATLGTGLGMAVTVRPRRRATIAGARAERQFRGRAGELVLLANVRWYADPRKADDAFRLNASPAAPPTATPPMRDSALERQPYTIIELTPPTDLLIPGRFAALSKVEGAAAVQTAIVTGTMLRERLVWELWMKSDRQADIGWMTESIFDLAVTLSTREIDVTEVSPDGETGHRGELWDLLPDETDVPAELHLEAEEGNGNIPP